MATKITVKKKLREPYLTLYLSIISKTINDTAGTETIDINNLALACFTFDHLYEENTYYLQSTIKVKKNADAKFPVEMKLNYDGQEKQWICNDDWMEIKMDRKKCDYNIPVTSNYNVHSTSIVVDITAHEIKAMSLLADKLFEDTALTDYHLCAKDGVVAMHKAILAMHSDVFMTMLSGEWKETEEGHVTIDGATTQTLEHLKRYIYLKTLPDNGIEPLLLIAARYMMDNLKADCIRKLLETATPEKLDHLVEFACANNVPDLIRAIIFEIPDSTVNSLYNLLKVKKTNNEDE